MNQKKEETVEFPWSTEDDALLGAQADSPRAEEGTKYPTPPPEETLGNAPVTLPPAQAGGEFSGDSGDEEKVELPVQQERPRKKSRQIPDGFVTRDIIRSKGTNWKAHGSHFVQLVSQKFGDHTSTFPKSHIHMVRVLKALAEGTPIDQASNEPKTYAEALAGPDVSLWKAAMEEKISSLSENDTWNLVEPPKAPAITDRWVYKIKKKQDGTLRYKARWVVH